MLISLTVIPAGDTNPPVGRAVSVSASVTGKTGGTVNPGIFGGGFAGGEFAGMLQTMVDNGTIAVDTAFRPGDSISREKMCKILYISLENAGKFGEVNEGAINGLSDYGEISDWAVKYVNAMYDMGIMIGVSDDRFAPAENLTKAQAATLLVRILALTEEAE